jgi:hypothetical protein
MRNTREFPVISGTASPVIPVTRMEIAKEKCGTLSGNKTSPVT